MDNKKGIPSSSKVVNTDEVCKSCNKTFDKTRILKHIIHGSCVDNYTNEEIDLLRELADERRKRKKIELRHIKRENKLKSNLLVSSEVCRSCEKKFSETSILKHITHNESCMKAYDDEEMGFLRSWADERRKDLKTDYLTTNKESLFSKDQKRHAKYWDKNKESIAKKRKEKSEKDKKSKQSLLEICKSCKNKMGGKSILKHLGQKESCITEYTEKEIEFLRGLSDKRKKQNNSSFYLSNKDAINSKKSQRYKQQKEEKRQELRRKGIERAKKDFEKSKESYEKDARYSNKLPYSIAKDNFPQVFAEFKTYSLSVEDSQTVVLLENSIEETYKKFENDISRVANIAKDLKYENNCCKILDDLYSKTNNWKTSKIQEEWHQLRLKIDLSLKEIATKLKKPYEWTYKCHCEECLDAKKIKGKGKGKKSKN